MGRRVAILYNEVPDSEGATGLLDRTAESGGLYDAIGAIAAACVANEWEAVRFGVGRDLEVVLGAAEYADVVFNLVEAVDGDAQMEATVASILEVTGVPFTGSPSAALALALNKPLTNAWLSRSGVRVPRGSVLETRDDPIGELRYPAIVKPSREDASLGIDDDSVVENEAQARQRAGEVIGAFRQPALVEEFVDGREVSAALLGPSRDPQVLPLREIDFSGLPSGARRILTRHAKWAPDTADYQGTVGYFPADLPEDLAAEVARVACVAWNSIGLRDYARVDTRVTSDGPYVIDVNTNPDLSTDAGFACTAEHAGVSYVELIRRIVEGAIARGHPAASPAD